MSTTPSSDQIRERVRARYANAARQVTSEACGCDPACCAPEPTAIQMLPMAAESACCGPDCCATEEVATTTEAFGATLYASAELAVLPAEAAAASLGCGNPTALAALRPGEVVLDLGSGGGIDVLLSARRVGATGKVYGLDMTDEMLDLARENQRKAGVTNVEFLRGQIENVPLPRQTIDVIISNCVVNLSTDKDAVLREAFRVLKPGGRLAISDVVVRDAEPGESPIPDAVRQDVEMWTGCIAGALEAQEYREKLAAAGFVAIEVQEVSRYTADAICGSECCGASAESTAHVTDEIASRFISAFIRAVKPQIGN